MPLGFERLNARKAQPNALINFIKPLPGSNEALAQDFLERVAAICYPVMKANHVAVMSLEEHEPNLEFVGRNFNAGEVIQLCLRAPYTGQWLPFRHVQMVMMHELAHCKQMNHSREFWKVRNQFAGELCGLWARNYHGEGMWSRGRDLLSGQYLTDTLPEATAMPRSLCGGTYRSSRKRKRKSTEKPKLSYAERQQRRIRRKFGDGGMKLGDDTDVRSKLEHGKKPSGNPRVAGSARGRELRAAAALARLDAARMQKEEDGTEDLGSDSEYSDDMGEGSPEGATIEMRGKSMVKVCADEDAQSEDARQEMDELWAIFRPLPKGPSRRRSPPLCRRGSCSESRGRIVHATPRASQSTEPDSATRADEGDITFKRELDTIFIKQEEDDHDCLHESQIKHEDQDPVIKTEVDDPRIKSEDHDTTETEVHRVIKDDDHGHTTKSESDERPIKIEDEDIVNPLKFENHGAINETGLDDRPIKTEDQDLITKPVDLDLPPLKSEHETVLNVADSGQDSRQSRDRGTEELRSEARQLTICPLCTVGNESHALTCKTCLHVLQPGLRDWWRCTSSTCRDSQYLNPGEFGRCAVCDSRKETAEADVKLGAQRGLMDPFGRVS